MDQINQKADQLNASGKQIKINATVGEVKTDGAASSTPIDVKGNVTSVTGTPSGTVDVKGKVTSVTGNPSGTVNVKGKLSGNLEGTSGKSGKVKFTADTSQVSGYKPANKNAKVIFGKNSSIPDNYQPADKSAKVNYTLGSTPSYNPPNYDRTVTYTIKTVGSAPTGKGNQASGTMTSLGHARAFASGSLTDFSPAFAKGNVSIPHDQQALVNEVSINGHSESIVRDGVWSMIPGGAHLANLKKGDIIFSASQTEALLKNGSIPGHARAYAFGTVDDVGDIDLSNAFAGGMHGNFAGGAAGRKLGSSNKKTNTTPTSSGGSGNSGGGNGGGGGGNNSSTTSKQKHAEQVFDWVARTLTKFKDTVENISNRINDYVSSAFKKTMLNRQEKAIVEEINANKHGAQSYTNKANSIASGYTYYYTPEGSDTEQKMNIVIPDSYKKAVQGGYWNIEDMDTTTDFGKGLAEAIQKYQDYYDKAKDCTQEAQNLYNEQLKVFEQWANMPTEDGGTSMSTAKFRVNHAGVLYATGANISGNITATSGTIGGCSIYNGTLIVPSANISGTLNASQIRIGDFTEYHDLTSETYSRYGFSIVADGNNNPWFVHTPQRDIQISPGQGYNSYKCNGGGTYHIEFEVSSTVQASNTDNYGNNTYVNINIGLYGINTDNSSCWYIPFGCRSNSSGSVQKVSTSVWLPSDVRSFSTFVQCAGSGTFSGTLKIRNISIRRMADNALIVDGAITADKISANAITSDKINVSQLSAISANLGSITGGSINIGGKFIVDSNGNFTATNGSLTGTVNATTMRAKQKYSIYDSSFNVYQDVIQWFGSSLSIGLTGGDDNGTLTVAGAYFDFLDNNIDCNGNLNIVNDGNLFVAKTTTTGSLSVSNTSTFNGATTFNSTLTCKSTSTFTGSLKAGSFTFRDYSEIDDNNIIYRRPVASAGSNKSRVAILQGTSNNKIIIKAQYNSTNFTNVTFTGSSSDVRLKKDIKDSSVNALSKIMQMQIREFNWKQTGVHQELGCVADELELIDPLLTVGGGYDDDGTMNIKSIDTLLLSEYAIKGIQELYRQNKQQQKRIEYLELQLNNK